MAHHLYYGRQILYLKKYTVIKKNLYNTEVATVETIRSTVSIYVLELPSLQTAGQHQVDIVLTVIAKGLRNDQENR